MLKKISASDRVKINDASRDEVKIGLLSLNRNFQNNIWLESSNTYLNNVIKTLNKNINSNTVNIDDLRQYIAASALIHCYDGWKFFSKALTSQLLGDSNICRHLAYYSELRATLSLLSSEGIMIFDNSHFILDSSSVCKKLDSDFMTHKITWDILELWLKTNKSLNLMKKIIKPLGQPLDQWFQNSPLLISSTLNLVSKKLFMEWGIDLENLRNDRKCRNEASYRPNQIACENILPANERLFFVIDFWSNLEPAPHSEFSKFDTYLLIEYLVEYYKSIDTTKSFDEIVNILYTKSTLTDRLLNFFHSFYIQGNSLITLAKKTDQTNIDSQHHLSVLSRASILLRIATGSVAELLKDCNYTEKDLSFWWKKMGIEHGLWNINNEPVHLTDLWIDIKDAIDNLNSSNIPGNLSINDLWNQNSLDCFLLTSCERIALWGMSL